MHGQQNIKLSKSKTFSGIYQTTSNIFTKLYISITIQYTLLTVCTACCSIEKHCIYLHFIFIWNIYI